MSDYKRWYRKGGTYFFTVVTHNRQKLFVDEQAQSMLREAIEWVRQRHPFEIAGMVLMPEHLHVVWKFPDDDSDFSRRWSMIKRRFTMSWKASGRSIIPVNQNQQRRRQQGLWQPRFWEHLIRDQHDFANHMDYLHYNPVKHGWVSCPHQWPCSTFHRWVKQGVYPKNWQCCCNGKTSQSMPFNDIKDIGE